MKPALSVRARMDDSSLTHKYPASLQRKQPGLWLSEGGEQGH